MDIQKIEKEISAIARRLNNQKISKTEKTVLDRRYKQLCKERNDLHGVVRPEQRSLKSESQEVADYYRREWNEIRTRAFKSWDSIIFDEYSTLQPIKPEPPKPVVMVEIPDYGEAPDNFKPHEFQWSENKTPREIRAMGSEFAMFQLIGKKW